MTLHISLSIVTYSLVTLSTLWALVLALQSYLLHNKIHSDWVIHYFPPLQIMESRLFQMIVLDLLLLSFTFISGLMLIEELAPRLVHKIALSIVALCILGILLWRYYCGWHRTILRSLILICLIFSLLYWNTWYS